jgi:hypothetical protein
MEAVPFFATMLDDELPQRAEPRNGIRSEGAELRGVLGEFLEEPNFSVGEGQFLHRLRTGGVQVEQMSLPSSELPRPIFRPSDSEA